MYKNNKTFDCLLMQLKKFQYFIILWNILNYIHCNIIYKGHDVSCMRNLYFVKWTLQVRELRQNILVFDRNDECIDLTLMCVFLCLKTLFKIERILLFLTSIYFLVGNESRK